MYNCKLWKLFQTLWLSVTLKLLCLSGILCYKWPPRPPSDLFCGSVFCGLSFRTNLQRLSMTTLQSVRMSWPSEKGTLSRWWIRMWSIPVDGGCALCMDGTDWPLQTDCSSYPSLQPLRAPLFTVLKETNRLTVKVVTVLKTSTRFPVCPDPLPALRMNVWTGSIRSHLLLCPPQRVPPCLQHLSTAQKDQRERTRYNLSSLPSELGFQIERISTSRIL